MVSKTIKVLNACNFIFEQISQRKLRWWPRTMSDIQCIKIIPEFVLSGCANIKETKMCKTLVCDSHVNLLLTPAVPAFGCYRFYSDFYRLLNCSHVHPNISKRKTQSLNSTKKKPVWPSFKDFNDRKQRCDDATRSRDKEVWAWRGCFPNSFQLHSSFSDSLCKTC